MRITYCYLTTKTMLRVTEEIKLAPETGSPFDRTKINLKIRAGEIISM